VSAKLSQAWQFLSGEQRSFIFLERHEDQQAFAEFSFFMPMEVKAEDRTGGVAVLIPREDALRVAAYMFAVEPSEVQEADLKDACAEVCNVFSDCIVMHVSGSEDVSIGLPAMADLNCFVQISKDSAVSAVYKSNIELGNLVVVVYDVLRQPL
jgi:L-lactate utilization protein LutC